VVKNSLDSVRKYFKRCLFCAAFAMGVPKVQKFSVESKSAAITGFQ
jgi:hypothetical protein